MSFRTEILDPSAFSRAQNCPTLNDQWLVLNSLPNQLPTRFLTPSGQTALSGLPNIGSGHNVQWLDADEACVHSPLSIGGRLTTLRLADGVWIPDHSITYGDGSTRAQDMCRMASGDLAACSYNWTVLPDKSLNGEWRIGKRATWASAPFNIPSTGGSALSATMVTIEHPSSGDLWLFSKRDGFQNLASVKRTPAGVITVNNTFLSSAVNGADSVEGEFPALRLQALENKIWLAYQSKEYKIVSTSPFYKASRMRICTIEADGTKAFITVPVWVERRSQFAFSVTADRITFVGYWMPDVQTIVEKWLSVWSYDRATQVWTEPVKLFRATTPPANISGTEMFVANRRDDAALMRGYYEEIGFEVGQPVTIESGVVSSAATIVDNVLVQEVTFSTGVEVLPVKILKPI